MNEVRNLSEENPYSPPNAPSGNDLSDKVEIPILVTVSTSLIVLIGTTAFGLFVGTRFGGIEFFGGSFLAVGFGSAYLCTRILANKVPFMYLPVALGTVGVLLLLVRDPNYSQASQVLARLIFVTMVFWSCVILCVRKIFSQHANHSQIASTKR